MSRYTGPKDKLSRREGFDLFGRGGKIKRLDVKPGEHGRKRAGKQSEYGKQLRSKQMAKRMYGVMERQFRNYIVKARKQSGLLRDNLVSLLERRLDNVVYRLGLAPTRPAARQMVSHGHIMVEGKILNIPSYEVKVGESVQLDEKAKNIPYIQEQFEEKIEIPDWLAKEQETKGKVIRKPDINDLKEPISLTDIIEFYSR